MTAKIQVKEFLVDQEEMEGQNRPKRTCRVLLREWAMRSSRRQLTRNCKEKKQSEEEKGKKEGRRGPPLSPGGALLKPPSKKSFRNKW